jgi:hypothetical protein
VCVVDHVDRTFAGYMLYHSSRVSRPCALPKDSLLVVLQLLAFEIDQTGAIMYDLVQKSSSLPNSGHACAYACRNPTFVLLRGKVQRSSESRP